MNWIERLYELKGKDPYSQNGEPIYLEYIFHQLEYRCQGMTFVDIGAGDGFHLSNTRYLKNVGWKGRQIDKIKGQMVTRENVSSMYDYAAIISIDIDGNDYWVLDTMLEKDKSAIVISEFNPAFSDSRTIKYNPDHVWDGTDYYGFSFEAGKKLFEKHGYKVIFNVANMNMIAVREDLINVTIPPVTYQVTNFFEQSKDREWVMI